MSSTGPTSQPNMQRPSRFIEGEPLTQSPLSSTNPFLASILSEQDQHESLRRSNPRSRQGSSSSINSTPFHSPTSAEILLSKSPIRSTRPVESMDWTTKTMGSSSGRTVTARKSLEESRPRQWTGGKIVGRLRALTGGQSTLERKIQRGEVVPYPGT